MTEPDGQAEFAARIEAELDKLPQGPALANIEGTWRKPYMSDIAHNVIEAWDLQFLTACNVWYFRVSSTPDEGAQRCSLCVKALDDKESQELAQ